MKQNELEIDYSPDLDILSVDDTDKEYDRLIRSGDFIIDLAPDGEVRGVEIQNISRILGLDREKLQNVSDVELQMTSDEEKVQVTVRLNIEEERNTLTAQLSQPDISRA